MTFHDDPLADERDAALDARRQTIPADDDRPSWREAEEMRVADEKAAAARAPRPRVVDGWTMRAGF